MVGSIIFFNNQGFVHAQTQVPCDSCDGGGGSCAADEEPVCQGGFVDTTPRAECEKKAMTPEELAACASLPNTPIQLCPGGFKCESPGDDPKDPVCTPNYRENIGSCDVSCGWGEREVSWDDGCGDSGSTTESCYAGPCTYDLTINRKNSPTPAMWGTGRVRGTVGGSSINCDLMSAPSCPYRNLTEGTSVNLNRPTASDYGTGIFVRWEGACSGNNNCSTTMNSNRTVTAAFQRPHLALSVSTRPSSRHPGGSASYDPVGASSGGYYNRNTTARPTAIPRVGFRFDRWSGDCSGVTCAVTMNTLNKSATAHFIGMNRLTLNKIREREGNGTVTAVPNIAGPSPFNPTLTLTTNQTSNFADYDYDRSVRITASPQTGSLFAGWSGSCSGTSTTCNPSSLLMDRTRTVTARFWRPQLEVVANPADAVSNITASGAASTVSGGTYTFYRNIGTTHTPALSIRTPQVNGNGIGYRFNNWTGQCNAGSNLTSQNGCTVTLGTTLSNGDRRVTANFTRRFELRVSKDVSAGKQAQRSTYRASGRVEGRPNPADTFNVPFDLDMLASQYLPNSPAVYEYDTGRTVRLTAVENPQANNSGSGKFRGWSGYCTHTNTTCSVPMTAVRNVTAIFEKLDLSIHQKRDRYRSSPSNFNYTNLPPIKSGVAGSRLQVASVDSTPDFTGRDIKNLGARVTPSFTVSGRNNDLNPGYRFVNWTGGCTGTSPSCTINMDNDRVVNANFTTVPPKIITFVSGSSDGLGTRERPIRYNTRANLTWTTEDAIDCQLANFQNPAAEHIGGIDSARPPNGIFNVISGGSNTTTSNLRETTHYQLSCYGPHPGSVVNQDFAQRDITIWVRSPEPTIEAFEIDPQWVRRGNNTVLSWEVRSPHEESDITTTCSIRNSRNIQEENRDWSTTERGALWEGSMTINNIQGVTTFTLSCQSESLVGGRLRPSDPVISVITAYILPVYYEY